MNLTWKRRSALMVPVCTVPTWPSRIRASDPPMPTTVMGRRPVLTKLAVAAWCEVVEPSTSALMRGR